MSEEKKAYTGIFKSTFLFGFVQVFNILIKIGLNKVIAVFLGTKGIGIIGLYQSAIAIIKSFAGLGINQSSVKDVSEVAITEDEDSLSRVITVVKKVVRGAALLGAIITIVLSPWLSEWSFQTKDYTFAFVWLSLVVVFNILTEGYLSILKGMRRLRDLAKTTMLGALGGVLAGIPLYILLGNKGIVPALISTAFFTFLAALFYIRKVKIDKVKISLREVWNEGAGMVKMGFSLMIAAFASYLSEFAVRAYISAASGLVDVGLFQVGATILTAYFGIVITALVTDYYPRIAAVNTQNDLVQDELNKQIKVGFLLLGPLVVTFILFLKFFLILLYSNEFLSSSEYILFAIFGTLIIIASNPMDLVLIAKSEAKLFLIISLIYRSIEVGAFILGYKLGGLSGLGVAVTSLGALHFIIMFTVNKWRYDINIERQTWLVILPIFALTVVAVLSYHIELLSLRILIHALLLTGSIVYTMVMMKREMQIDVIDLGLSKIRSLIKK